MEAHTQDNRAEVEVGDIEFCETVAKSNEMYENTHIAESVLDNTNAGLNEHYETIKKAPNAGLNEHYETLQAAQKQDNKSNVSKSVYTTGAKQKAVLLILIVLVITCVLISSVSLVIALTSKDKAEAVDGSWSNWELWEACSTTCDVGMQRRHRNCSNPVPLGNGRQCLGVDNEQKLCIPGPCSNGGWSAWGSWGSCSTSCNVGLKSRFRTCTNPRPSLFGSFCEGDNMQVEICESSPCNETHVAFNVYHSSVTGDSGSHTIIFTKILFNEGGAYNETTGVFAAPFSGLYQFNGQICTAVGQTVEYTLQSEGMSFASGEHRTSSDAIDGKCTSFSAVASMLKDDKVWIKSQYLFQNDNDWNSFSGILIHKTQKGTFD